MTKTTTPTHNYSNVCITGTGLTYTTATSASTWIVNEHYVKQPRVQITEEDITLDGLSLRETMLSVKNELMIPTRINRNRELEQEFEELKAVADRYRELEQKFLEQKKMWQTLKTQHR